MKKRKKSSADKYLKSVKYAQDINIGGLDIDGIDPEVLQDAMKSTMWKAGGAALGGGLLGYLAQKHINPGNALKRVQQGYADNLKKESGLGNRLKHLGSAIFNGYPIFPPSLGGGLPIAAGSVLASMSGHPYLGLGMLGAQAGSKLGTLYKTLTDKNYFNSVKQTNAGPKAQTGNEKWITTKTGKRIPIREGGNRNGY